MLNLAHVTRNKKYKNEETETKTDASAHALGSVQVLHRVSIKKQAKLFLL